MTEEELKKKILDIIYLGDWHFDVTANGEVDQYYMDNEDDVVEKIIKKVKEE